MAFLIKISPVAEKDLVLAFYYFESLIKERAFIDELATLLKYLRKNPYLFQVYYKEVRIVHFTKFNFSIHYLVSNETVYILRILTQNKNHNPNSWNLQKIMIMFFLTPSITVQPIKRIAVNSILHSSITGST